MGQCHRSSSACPLPYPSVVTKVTHFQLPVAAWTVMLGNKGLSAQCLSLLSDLCAAHRLLVLYPLRSPQSTDHGTNPQCMLGANLSRLLVFSSCSMRGACGWHRPCQGFVKLFTAQVCLVRYQILLRPASLPSCWFSINVHSSVAYRYDKHLTYSLDLCCDIHGHSASSCKFLFCNSPVIRPQSI